MKKKHKILIVEDNPANMELFLDILNIGEYDCVCTTRGEDALDMAKAEKPDLLLLDIQLPGIDGLAVRDMLRSSDETRHIKIIALTAYAMKGDKEMFIEKGFDGYIPKPIRIKEFLESIKNYLQES